MHSILRRQLSRLNLADATTPPTAQEWAELVNAVSTQYGHMEKEYQLVEQSLHLSTEEMSEIQELLKKKTVPFRGYW